nr:arylesterase [Halopseudomonas salegens]
MLWLLALPLHAQSMLIVGDSISAAFGLEIEQGWVSLLEQRLDAENHDVDVINASVSGDTTAGGVARLAPLLARHSPDLVIIELGGNDGLRGMPPTNMQQNLSSMVERSQAAGADVLLLGMEIPPNYGVRYTSAFRQVFVAVSENYEIPLLPFLLAPVAEDPALMQSDGIHPTAAAQPLILEHAWPLIEAWLDEQAD